MRFSFSLYLDDVDRAIDEMRAPFFDLAGVCDKLKEARRFLRNATPRMFGSREEVCAICDAEERLNEAIIWAAEMVGIRFNFNVRRPFDPERFKRSRSFFYLQLKAFYLAYGDGSYAARRLSAFVGATQWMRRTLNAMEEDARNAELLENATREEADAVRKEADRARECLEVAEEKTALTLAATKERLRRFKEEDDDEG